MARPVKWERDVRGLLDRAKSARTETYGRRDIERLFGVSRVSAQSLMKAIGAVQPVGAAHFVERARLIEFLTAVDSAPHVGEALQTRLAEAAPVPSSRTLRVPLPAGLRHAMLPDLPANISLGPGRIVITGSSAADLAAALAALATVMQNDLERWQQAVTPADDAE